MGWRVRKKLVSVVIVTKNRYKLLLRALESISTQAYAPIEVVLIDNQSNDPVQIEEGHFKNLTIRVKRTNRHLNSSEARNYGISFSNGDYVCFLDDDDYYLKDKISISAKYLEANQDIGMVYGSTQMLGVDGENLGLCSGIPEPTSVMLYRYVHLNSIMVRRDIFKQVLFDESLTRCVDVDFTIRVITNYKATQIDKVFAVWNRDARTDQLTESGWKSMARNWLILCGKHQQLIRSDFRVSSYYYRKMAGLSLVNLQLMGFLIYSYFFIRFGWLEQILDMFID
jgi:glycosyltransferase involved in cell wall biosynthesis